MTLDPYVTHDPVPGDLFLRNFIEVLERVRERNIELVGGIELLLYRVKIYNSR